MHQKRKSDHITINLTQDVDFSDVTAGFERYRLPHCALPEIDLADVSTSTRLLGKPLAMPLVISSMTGGTSEARAINHHLAEAAQLTGLALGVGSQRAALEDDTLISTYQVRDVAPDILLLANLGAIQLNYGYGIAECRRAVDMITADALILHLNALQEAIQPEGNTRFDGLLSRIEAVCRALEVPVIVKEVGWGISEHVARQLADAGAAAIDVAGAGGTSWSTVEMFRTTSAHGQAVAEAFRSWGIPTVASLLQARRGAPEIPILASGGIRSGIDIAKAVALGAGACGIAGPFLRAAASSTAAVIELIHTLHDQMRIALFCAGTADISQLQALNLQDVETHSPHSPRIEQ